MRLSCHPDTPSKSVSGIDATGERRAGGLIAFHFTARAELGSILLSARTEPKRAAGLWQKTCFEAFVRAPGKTDYAEFNFSPSSQWAAYRFEAYRAGMADLWLDKIPEVAVSITRDAISLSAVLMLPEPWDKNAIDIGLSAAIEEANGTKSYWALAHPAGKPDFHHPDCFALTLPAPETL